MNRLDGELLRAVSRSFFLSIQALPRAIRDPVALAYLLARATDTIADTASAPAELRLMVLQDVAEMIRGARVGPVPAGIAPESPAERELLARLPECLHSLERLEPGDRAEVRTVLEKITEGQRKDLLRFDGSSSPQMLETAIELEDYAYLVAGCVGEFWTRICFAHLQRFSTRSPEEMCALGKEFGKGLQLVNILRDLPADLPNGRCYLPREEVGALDPLRLRESFMKWLGRAEAALKAGREYIVGVRTARIRYACFLPWSIGVETLRLMHREPPLDSPRRVKVSRARVRWAMLIGVPWVALIPHVPRLRK